jgi:hypothetical protein
MGLLAFKAVIGVLLVATTYSIEATVDAYGIVASGDKVTREVGRRVFQNFLGFCPFVLDKLLGR